MGLALQIAALAGLGLAHAPAPLLAALAGGVVGGLALTAAHAHTTASAHTSVIAIYAGVLATTHLALSATLALTATAAAWSRVRLGAHTPTQAYAWPLAIGSTAALDTLIASACL